MSRGSASIALTLATLLAGSGHAAGQGDEKRDAAGPAGDPDAREVPGSGGPTKAGPDGKRAPGDPDQESQPGTAAGDAAGQAQAVDEGAVAVTGEIPDGYDQFEITDVTVGMRDDYFMSVEVGGDGTIWAGTWQGRVYRSRDSGRTWTEATVLPERKPLYGFVDQQVLFGHLRSDLYQPASRLDLAPQIGRAPILQRERKLADSNLSGALGINPQNLSLMTRPDWMLDEDPGFPLIPVTRSAVGAESVVLGAGLSTRAPRLALLLTILRRPVANISLQRLLFLTARRDPYIYRVVPHPSDTRRAFAGTGFGLYESFDDGVSWHRTFPGLTTWERVVSDVVADPKNPDRLYMATSRGLYQSDDGGDSWRKNTKVPELWLKKIAVDPEEPRYVYVAGYGSVYRSDDYGETFVLAFYHSLRLRREVHWMVIDPFDSNTAYLGTADGLLVTNNLRTSTSQDWRVVSGLTTVNHLVSTVDACSRHRGHIYMLTRTTLPHINYVANGPESLMLESWDYGKSWRVLAGNRTGGDIRWFSLDRANPDTVWVAFSRALVRIDRKKAPVKLSKAEQRQLTLGQRVAPDDPSMSEVVEAALDYHEVSMRKFNSKVDRLRHRSWIPKRLNVTFGAGRFRVGNTVDDIQYPNPRFLGTQISSEWRVMAWATWALPDLVHRQDSAAMLRFRVLMMDDEVRNRIMYTVHRNYGELQRLKARQQVAAAPDLQTRIDERLRIDYLEALVDLASGGYLTKHRKRVDQ